MTEDTQYQEPDPDQVPAPEPGSERPPIRPSSSPLAPGLYLVATPIGNLEDITLRALRVLGAVDRIACEDTRQTARLLCHFGIRTPTVSYHTHNEGQRAQELIAELKAGGRVAVVSDAGIPGISDPGAVLAEQAIRAGVPVYPIPGANAALSALIASGLPAEAFTFHGFLPSRLGQRRTALEALRAGAEAAPPVTHTTTHIFYETPHRILEALEDIVSILGPERRVALARELTKLHEEFLRGSAAEILAALRARPSIRGEMVLLIAGDSATARMAGSAHSEGATAPSLTVAEEVATLMRSESLTEKEALKRVARSRGIGKSEAYRELQRGSAQRR